MSASSSSSTPLDIQKYREWFEYQDNDRDGFLSQSEATAIFNKFDLTPKQMQDVMALIKPKFKNSWSFEEFVKCLRLISMAKDDEELDGEKANSGSGMTKTLELSDLDSEIKDFASSRSSESVLANITSVTDGLIRLYEAKLKPLEIAFGYHEFVSLQMTIAEFKAKPMILVLGQTSGGKTTFICDFINEKYAGSKIGEQATTDKFYVLMGKPTPAAHTGTNAVQMHDLPFAPLPFMETRFLGDSRFMN